MIAEKTERSQVQVIDRAVALLEVLAEEQRGVSLGELASRTGLAKPTARRVLASLEQHRFCDRTATGTYELGLGVFELGMRLYNRLDLRLRSRPALEALSASTGLTVYLCALREHHAVCVELILGRYEHTFGLKLGGRLPLHVGAAGKATLAWGGEDFVDEYLETWAPLQRLTAKTLVDPAAVRAELARCRRRGYTVSDEDVIEGAAAIGAPVFDHAGAAVAGISVSGLRPQILGGRKSELVDTVQETAAAISASLGARPGAASG
jgi:DNA-binding IclR family transcriptional regulator